MSGSTGDNEKTVQHSKTELNGHKNEDAVSKEVSGEIEEEEIEEIKYETEKEIKDEIKKKKQSKKSDENKKAAKLEKALEKMKAERDSLKDSYQRTFSEFNNFKKRTQFTASTAAKIGVCDTIEKILPVIDNFERALEHVDEQEDDAFATGVSMVYKQLIDIFESMGIKEIPALGEVFDPNLHQAIQQVPAQEGTPANVVVTVVQKGYKQEDKIIRHSMVIVSK